MTYLITFSCYGQHLHGDEGGSVNRDNNTFGNDRVPADTTWVTRARRLMDQPPYTLDFRRRNIVMASVREVCSSRDWTLLAAHVRSTHVHVVVDADAPPEKIMGDFKTYASRHLNLAELDEPTRKRWARHGSTRRIWRPRMSPRRFDTLWMSRGSPWRCSKTPLPTVAAQPRPVLLFRFN